MTITIHWCDARRVEDIMDSSMVVLTAEESIEYEKELERSAIEFQESLETLPETRRLKFEDFEVCGTVVSSWRATCPRCGNVGEQDRSVLADIRVQKDPENPNGRLLTSVIFCQVCNMEIAWGFKITE